MLPDPSCRCSYGEGRCRYLLRLANDVLLTTSLDPIYALDFPHRIGDRGLALLVD